MCNHQYQQVHIPGLSTQCELSEYFKLHQDEQWMFPDLPLDSVGKCVFHSSQMKWKKEQRAGERFVELIQRLAADLELDDIDLREMQLIGVDVGTYEPDQKEQLTLSSNETIPICGIHFQRAVRLMGTRFLADLLIDEVVFGESTDFDAAVFKGVTLIKNSQFESTVSFIHDCRFEHNLMVEQCRFLEHTDFQEAVCMQQLFFTDVEFAEESSWVNLNQIAPDLIVQWSHVRFGSYTDFTNAGFNSSVTFDQCQFLGETHFVNTAFRKRLQISEPVIGDKVFFRATKPGVKLFENAVDFSVVEESFQEMGQLIFEQVNLYNFDVGFKSQIKTLELEHKIELRQGCSLFRASLERYFSYSDLKQILLEDICRAITNFFACVQNRSLQIDVTHDLKKDTLRVIFHTEENISPEELENLLFTVQQEVMKFVLEPGERLKIAPDRAQLMDIFLNLKHLWERMSLALQINALDENILQDVLTEQSNTTRQDHLQSLFRVSWQADHLQLHIHNYAQIERQINIGQSEGNVFLGNLNATDEEE